MSELIAEARVLVTPDTTTFRQLLVTQLAVATRGVTVPVNVVPGTVSTAGLEAATAANLAGARAARQAAEEERRLNQERRASARTAEAHSRQLSQLLRGAAGAALSMTDLRGATLAATGPFLAGAAAVAVFAKSLGTAVAFETSLNVFRATTDATADDMERIAETAKQLGADLTLPGVTANSAAEALSQLSRAGLDVEDSIAGVRGTLQLATAAAIDNEQAVLLVANAINAFKLEGEDASRVADLLAASSKESQGSIVDMGLALQQSAAAAAQAGVSVEDTIALLTQLGRAGLRGSDAGTSLRVALLRLINPTKQAKEALDGLGVAIRDQQGNIRPEAFAEITSQLSQFTKAQHDATLALIFGQDAFRAASIIGREGASGLREMRDATQEVEVAAELAGARTQGLAGAWENLKNQGGTLGLTIGKSLSEPTEAFVEILADGVKNINTFIDFLGGSDDQAQSTAEAYTDLVQQAGRLNRALAEREGVEQQNRGFQRNIEVITAAGRAGDGLREKTRRVNEELAAQASASLLARNAIEGYTQSVRIADQALGSLGSRIDESTNRFAQPLPTPTLVPQGPVPIGPTARLEGEAAIAAATDDLQRLLEIRQRQFDQAKTAFENAVNKNVRDRTALFNDMRDKEAAVITVRRQIAAQQEAANRQVANDEQQAQRAADQAFLAQQERSRQQQQNRIARTALTAGVADDLREQRDFQSLLGQQIQALRNSALSEAAKRDAIAALVAATISTTTTIRSLQQSARQQQSEQRVAMAELNFQNAELLAQLTESDKDNERVLRAQIRFFSNEAKRLGRATEAGKTAANRALGFVVQLRELLKARAEAAGELEGSQGTSVADLLRENARIFAQSAGNVIGADQPFDSPAAFSSSLARFLTPTGRNPTIEVVAKRDTGMAAIDRQIQNLIDALNLNTAALGGGGPAKDSDYRARHAKALAGFYESRVARDRVDARRSGV